MAYDDILHHVGDFGRYQKRVYFLMIVFAGVMAYSVVAPVFMTYLPEFRCAVPGLVNDTYEIQDEAHAALVNLAIPYDANKGKYSECTVYRVTSLSNTSLGADSNTTQPCERWVYSKEVFTSTISTQLDLVCDRRLFKTHADMLALFGMFVFSLIGGSVSDKFGRKRYIMISYILNVVVSLIFTFINSVISFMIARFASAGLAVSLLVSASSYYAEIVLPDKRAFTGLMHMALWAVSILLTCLDYYLFNSWTTANLVFMVPSLLITGVFYFVPESPRWLISVGRYKEARRIILEMERVNKTKVPRHLLQWEENTTAVPDKSTRSRGKNPILQMRHLFNTPRNAVVSIIMCFNFTACITIYYGILLGPNTLIRFNIFLKIAVMTVLETVSAFFMVWLLGRMGRKPVYCVSMLIGGGGLLATIAPTLAGSQITWINMALANTSRFFASGAFLVLFIWASEMLPTCYRSLGVGTYCSVGRVGGMVAPYIASISYVVEGNVGVALALGIFGAVPILSGLLSLLLFETRNRQLADTSEEIDFSYRSSKEETDTREITAVHPTEEYVPMTSHDRCPDA